MHNLESSLCEAVGYKDPGINWAQERRLEFIDYRLRWNQRITRRDIREFFGVTAAQASRDLAEYEALAPENLACEPDGKLYRATDSFLPIYASSSMQQHLDDLLRAVIQPGAHARDYAAGESPIAVAPLPARKLDADVTGLVLMSIRSLHSLQITYRCLDNPEGIKLEVTPHAIIQDGTRWLARCWCGTRAEFDSYDLTRIVRAELLGPDLDRSGLDRAWERMVKVIITPNPELTSAQRQLIEDDYGMVGGELQLECRRALLTSMLRQLSLLGAQCGSGSEVTSLSVKNWEVIQPLLLP
ncbi:WYL domain-containing protein [Pseudomonas putida]|uniref:WYL domain-containing protein n=1 Tax=Pseudomonas putida TaxID=303 RepID=UPI00346558E3